MNKNNVIDLAGREENGDPLTELLRTGAQRLILQAVKAAGGIAGDTCQTSYRGSGTQRLSAGTQAANGRRPGDGSVPKVRAGTRRARRVSVDPGTTVCEEDKIAGGGGT